MKRIIMFALAGLMVTVSGCDMFRKIAGRPTSEDLELKRQMIVAKQHRQEEIRLQRQREEEMRLKRQADSLAFVDSVRRSGTVVRPITEITASAVGLEAGFCVVIGSFTKERNADRLVSTAAAEGYSPLKINFGNGYVAVGICLSESLRETVAALEAVRGEAFCPKDAWILVNK